MGKSHDIFNRLKIQDNVIFKPQILLTASLHFIKSGGRYCFRLWLGVRSRKQNTKKNISNNAGSEQCRIIDSRGLNELSHSFAQNITEINVE